MVSNRVDFTVDVSTAAAEANIERMKAQADAAVQKWRLQRVEIIQGIRETMTLLSSMMTSASQVMTLIGQQIDPFFSALIGMTLSTISMMLSMSAALSATVIGVPAALLIGSIAIGLNLVLLMKLLKDKAETMTFFTDMRQSMAGQRTAIGGSF